MLSQNLPSILSLRLTGPRLRGVLGRKPQYRGGTGIIWSHLFAGIYFAMSGDALKNMDDAASPAHVDVDVAADELSKLPLPSSADEKVEELVFEFTDEEIAACKSVKAELKRIDLEGGEALTDREIVIFTLISKLRVEKTVERCKDFLKVLKQYNIDYRKLHPEYDGFDVTPNRKFFNAYQVCGRDVAGRGIMWIEGNEEGIQPKDEAVVVQTGTMYYMAVHCDLPSLRNGITFVIDTSKNPVKPVGNERKLQKTWQSLPLRPQNIFIMGAGFFKKLFINALIKFASMFTKNKVIERVSFVGMKTVRKHIDEANMPEAHGGAKRQTPEAWTLGRLVAFAKQLPKLE